MRIPSAAVVALLGLAFGLVLVVGRPQLARAQSKTGTTIGTFLTIEPDARLAGMGNAGASIGDGLEAYWFNPAAAANLTHKEALLSHVEWIAGIQFDHVATSIPLGHLGTGVVSITSLRSGDIDVRTVSQPLGTGERYNVADVAIGLGLARPITDRFRVGGQISVMQERIFNSTLGAASVNLGAIYRVTDNGLVMGASLANLGVGGRFSGDNLSVTFDEDPSRNGDNGSLPASIFTDHFGMPILMRFGAAWPWKLDARDKITFAVDALHPSDNSESVSLGAEYAYKTLFALRGGWQRLAQQDAEGGLTLGAGVRGEMNNSLAFRFDYAYSDQGRLLQAHRFTVGVEF
jgi:opacity protein-like surface antigen